MLSGAGGGVETSLGDSEYHARMSMSFPKPRVGVSACLHHVRRFGGPEWLAEQTYLHPYPDPLSLEETFA